MRYTKSQKTHLEPRYKVWLWNSRNDFIARLKRRHVSRPWWRHVYLSFILHQLRLQRINTSCVEVVALTSRVCF